jgi:hypothetical protein
MLFVLLMECFHALIPKVESHGLLQELGGNTFRFHTSLYANDVVAFFSPVELDLQAIKENIWRPRFLINPNGRSNLLTMVKPRSTWVLTSKTSPTNPNEPLDRVNTHLWSNFGQRHGQTLPKP